MVSSDQSAWSEMISGSSAPRWRARARTPIQPEAIAGIGSVKRRDQRSAIAEGGQSTIAPLKVSRIASDTSAMSPRSTPCCW